MSKTMTVKAIRWRGGWELHIDDHHCTQSKTLDQAERQIRDYLYLNDPDTNYDDWTITVIPQIDSYAEAVDARRRTTEAAAAQKEAAAASRAAVRHLRAEGLTMAECATVLGVTRGRVAQLAHG